MKRSILVLSLVLVLGLGLVFGGYAFYGSVTENGIRDYFEGKNPLKGANLELASYERGYFKSRATSSISLSGSEEPIRLVNEIYHGPFAFTPDGVKPGSGYIVSKLDLESLPEEVRQEVKEVFAGKDPLVVKTEVSFGGGRTSALTIASVDHKKDGMQVRFDGGSGNITFSPDQTKVDGQLAIEPLVLRFQEEEESFRIRTARTTASLKSTGNGASMNVAAGGTTVSFEGDGGGSLEIEGIQFRSDFSRADGKSELMLGDGAFEIPSAKFMISGKPDGTGKGSVELKDLNFRVKTDQSGKHITTGAEYSAGALMVDLDVVDKPAPYLDLFTGGARMSASATLPQEIMEEFATFQSKMNSGGVFGESFASAEPNPEQMRELAQLIENAFRKINAGSGMRFELGAGAPDSGAKLSIEFAYRGSRPLTTQKTYIELIEASEMKLESRVPKSIIEANPEMLEQVHGMIAMGAVKEDGAVFSSTLNLKGAELSANGEPLPILQDFLPILSQEIAWDAFFTGMRKAAEAGGGAPSPEPGSGTGGN